MLHMCPSKAHNYAAHEPLQGPQLCCTCAPPRPTTMLHMLLMSNDGSHATNDLMSNDDSHVTKE